MIQKDHNCTWDCSNGAASFWDKIYVLDFAGGGAVHLIGMYIVIRVESGSLPLHGPYSAPTLLNNVYSEFHDGCHKGIAINRTHDNLHHDY